MPPDPPRMSMLCMLSVLRTLFTYTIICRYRPVGWGAPLALSAPGPLISVGSPGTTYRRTLLLLSLSVSITGSDLSVAHFLKDINRDINFECSYCTAAYIPATPQIRWLTFTLRCPAESAVVGSIFKWILLLNIALSIEKTS